MFKLQGLNVVINEFAPPDKFVIKDHRIIMREKMFVQVIYNTNSFNAAVAILKEYYINKLENYADRLFKPEKWL